MASRACTSPVGLEDERVDLGQVGVALGVGGVELQQDVDRAVGGGGVELGGHDPLAARGLGEAVDRVDPDLGDGVGVRRRPPSRSRRHPGPTACPGASWPTRSRVKLA